VQIPDIHVDKHVVARRGLDRFCWDILTGLTSKPDKFPGKKSQIRAFSPFGFGGSKYRHEALVGAEGSKVGDWRNLNYLRTIPPSFRRRSPS
jgi:hypothetical protein